VTELPKPRYIDTDEALSAWVEHCGPAEIIAVDTESDSFHHYREKVCLVQMTARGVDAIIDPLAPIDLTPLGPLLADRARTKIFHDACYDLICIKRDFGFDVLGIWDTMLASRLLGNKSFGLANILRESFGHEANKRLQRSDWTRRPLSPEQISYARYDTHFLERLMRRLAKDLARAGRLEWAEEDFARLPDVAERIAARPAQDRANGFWRIRGIRSLSPAVLGRVRALFAVRDKIAERLDRPPFKIFGDKVLVDLAKSPPRSMAAFFPRPGLRRAGIDRFGAEILRALRNAAPVTEAPPRDVRPRRRSGRLLDPRARDRYEALRTLRKSKAAELDLEPEVALSNALLEELARISSRVEHQVRSIEELQGWRGPLFTDEIIPLLRGGKTKKVKKKS
jgi:ribonuclease D